ncbi:MAG: hypothetical protein ACR2RB_02760, partial [Gammaproteobacteria bacterium]
CASSTADFTTPCPPQRRRVRRAAVDKAWKSPPHPGATAGREILGLFVQDFTGKVLILLLLCACASVAFAQSGSEPAQSGDRQTLDEEVQSLKQQVIELNRDLFVLEEELLFPSNTQFSVFVSVDVGTFFNMDSVRLKIDDVVVSNYLYTEREVEALHRGGVHRIYTGNLRTGEHDIVALITGTGPKGRDYRRGANITIKKGVGSKFVELKITDRDSKQQPEFIVKEW